MKFVLLVLTACVLGANAQFVFRRCGGNNDLNVKSGNLQPGVITMPGRVKISFEGAVQKPFKNLDLKLDVFLKTAVGEVKIPCLFNFGSCTYLDMCTVLDRMERENWAGVGTKLARTIKDLIKSIDGAGSRVCPFTVTSVKVSNRDIDLPAIPPVLASISSGKYRVKAELNNNETKALMSCFEFEFELRRA